MITNVPSSGRIPSSGQARLILSTVYLPSSPSRKRDLSTGQVFFIKSVRIIPVTEFLFERQRIMIFILKTLTLWLKVFD